VSKAGPRCYVELACMTFGFRAISVGIGSRGVVTKALPKTEKSRYAA